MTIAFASDHGGLDLKSVLIEYAIGKGFSVNDYGTFTHDSCDYVDFAAEAARSVADGKSDLAVVVCTTGEGVCMTANKIKGVRCALCMTEFQAEMTRRHNDANALALGQKVTDVETAKKIFDLFTATGFEGGRHERRVMKIKELEDGTRGY